ncbi:MAG: sigma 54-interacting transcriptional regulator [Polyangia bacterium]
MATAESPRTRLSPDLTATRTLRPVRLVDEGVLPVGGRALFLVIEGTSSSSFELPAVGTVIIGRAPDATLRLEDQSASRHHARVDLGPGGALLYDLESRNGTRVNGELLTGAHTLRAGDVVTLCNATLVFQRSEALAALRPIFGTAHLRQRLEEEIDRSLRYHRPVSVLCFHFAQPAAQAAVAGALSEQLRVMDTAAWHGETELLLLLPELDHPEATALADHLLERLGAVSAKVQAGLVTCPRDGADPDSLVAGAVAAARSLSATTERRPLTPEDTVRSIQIGERRILLVDAAMKRLYDLIEKLAPADLPVLIQGETGAGKELAAATLHHLSKRSDRPLVSLNCAALAENLIESELFGHERGAFSGAVAAKPGLLETANKGTLFLDEIGEMPQALQAKLLRVLETQRVMRVGETRERPIDIRLVAATNRDLQAEVAAGRFRKDLYFRLSTARILLPPLRDRPRELPVLARSLLGEACRRLGRAPMEIAPATMHRLLTYRWPGNVRELRNLMDFLAATVEEDTLLPWHVEDQLDKGALPPLEPGQLPGMAPPNFRPIDEELRELERRRMKEAILAAGGVHVRAAELISMPIRTFTAKLKLYQLSSREGTKKGT